jgi:hypothetical protein
VGIILEASENLALVRKAEQFSKRFYLCGSLFLFLILGILIIVYDDEGVSWRDMIVDPEFAIGAALSVFVFLLGLFSRPRVYRLLKYRPNTVEEIWVEKRGYIPIVKFTLIFLHFVDSDGKRMGIFANWIPLELLLDEVKNVAPQAVIKQGVPKAKGGFRRFVDIAFANTHENRLRIIFIMVLVPISLVLSIKFELIGDDYFMWDIVCWYALQTLFIFLSIKFLKALRARRYDGQPPWKFNGTFAYIYSYLFVFVGLVMANHCVNVVRWGRFEAFHAGLAASAFVLLAIPACLAFRYVTKPSTEKSDKAR